MTALDDFRRALALAQGAERKVQEAKAGLSTCAPRIEEGVNGGFERSSKGASKGSSNEGSRSASDHRRQHRPGRPRRIDIDEELRAFIQTRIDTLTFDQIAAAVAESFPPHRQVKRSAIHDWYRTQR
ncbi:MAG: hypothetical protein AAF943_18470 [Pseudomonadota bacterium]